MDSTEIKQLENSEVEITGEIPAEEFEKHRAKAIKKLGENVEVHGFRKGHVPENILMQKVGDGAILEEMAEMALTEWYPKIVVEKKIEAIGRPEIAITKLAAGNPLGFKIKTAVVPKVELPDYKQIAGDIAKEEGEPVVVTDEEVEKTIEEIRRNFARTGKDSAESGIKNQELGGGESEILGSDGRPVQLQEKKGEEKLPELTDEFVRKIGKFENVEDFKNKIRENLKEEKKMKEKEKKRIAIIEALVAGTNIAVPEVLIEGEQERMLAQFKDQIAMAGMKPEDYFKQTGKTEEELKKETRPDAEKRVKTQLIVSEIAQKENIKPAREEVDAQVEQIKKMYPGVEEGRARAYVESMMISEKVFEMLESNNANKIRE